MPYVPDARQRAEAARLAERLLEGDAARRPTGPRYPAADLGGLVSMANLYGQPAWAPRGPIGWLLLQVRRVARVIMAPWLQRQGEFNAALLRALAEQQQAAAKDEPEGQRRPPPAASPRRDRR